jgi:hypothetical protein
MSTPVDLEPESTPGGEVVSTKFLGKFLGTGNDDVIGSAGLAVWTNGAY